MVGGTYTVVVGVGAGGVVGVGVGAAGRTGACVVGGAVAGRLGVDDAFGGGVDARARDVPVDVVTCDARGVVTVVVVAPPTSLPCAVGGGTTFESAATWLTMTPDARPAPRKSVCEIRLDRLNRRSR